MKKITLTIFLAAFLCLAVFSQTAPQPSPQYDKIFTKVEHPATFPGGEENFKKFLDRNLNVKGVAAYLKDTPQVVLVKFLVDMEGNVSTVSVTNAKDVDPKLAEEAMKMIKKGPKWQPAIQNNRNVIYQVIQPITFPAKDRIIG